MNFATADGFIVIYCILTGVSIVAFWINLFSKKQLLSSRFPQKKVEVVYHVAAEFLTAILLMGSAAGFILGFSWSRVLLPVSLGMLLYAQINGPGFYAGQENSGMVRVFYVTAIFTAIATAVFVFAG